MATFDYVVETVTWHAQAGVTEQQMILAVQMMLADLKVLPGFIHELLTLAPDGSWMQLYYWQTAADAHNSNQLMADKASFNDLIALLNPQSIKIEIYQPVQTSSALKF
ncbi:hypothetical protein [Shewanella sp. YLB-07]|uniref:hypothetical protein n=1 Tax=Shewanella sp. YLB-07 TaxID=2601268 RepID=UPI0012CBF2DF|nr:hypothetical protein [Shewanella sp. YLB-07]MPY23004.1 hypothetical protein [Shewanella sp. YLB-07]